MYHFLVSLLFFAGGRITNVFHQDLPYPGRSRIDSFFFFLKITFFLNQELDIDFQIFVFVSTKWDQDLRTLANRGIDLFFVFLVSLFFVIIRGKIGVFFFLYHQFFATTFGEDPGQIGDRRFGGYRDKIFVPFFWSITTLVLHHHHFFVDCFAHTRGFGRRCLSGFGEDRDKIGRRSGQDRDKIGTRSGEDRDKISPGEDILPEKICSHPWFSADGVCFFRGKIKIGTRSGEDRDKIGGRSGQDRGKIGGRSGEDRDKMFSRRRFAHTPGFRPTVSFFPENNLFWVLDDLRGLASYV